MDDSKQSATPGEPVYSYKPSFMGALWQLQLTPDNLAWNRGYRSGRLPYRDIARIRISFRPVTMQPQRYLTEIWAPGTPKLTIASASWKSMVEQESLIGPYSEFVTQLHQRVAAAGGRPQCQSGMHPFLYWPGVVVYGGVLIALAALIVSALRVSSYPGALFVAAFMAFFGWQFGKFFRLNRPGRYEAGVPPQNLLPRA